MKTFIFLLTLISSRMLFADPLPAQPALRLRAVGNGEKVQLSVGSQRKTILLEENNSWEFLAGGEAPHKYTTLLSVQKNGSFYLVARIRSGPAISAPMAPCSGDSPETLLLIETDGALNVKNIQTEIFASCAFNGFGRLPEDPLQVLNNKVFVSFNEGVKKYELFFDLNEAEKGLQLNIISQSQRETSLITHLLKAANEPGAHSEGDFFLLVTIGYTEYVVELATGKTVSQKDASAASGGFCEDYAEVNILLLDKEQRETAQGAAQVLKIKKGKWELIALSEGDYACDKLKGIPKSVKTCLRIECN